MRTGSSRRFGTASCVHLSRVRQSTLRSVLTDRPGERLARLGLEFTPNLATARPVFDCATAGVLQQRLQLTDGATLTTDPVLHHSNKPGVERCTGGDASKRIGGHEAYADADDE
jgi:hypothetical protein